MPGPRCWRTCWNRRPGAFPGGRPGSPGPDGRRAADGAGRSQLPAGRRAGAGLMPSSSGIRSTARAVSSTIASGERTLRARSARSPSRNAGPSTLTRSRPSARPRAARRAAAAAGGRIRLNEPGPSGGSCPVRPTSTTSSGMSGYVSSSRSQHYPVQPRRPARDRGREHRPAWPHHPPGLGQRPDPIRTPPQVIQRPEQQHRVGAGVGQVQFAGVSHRRAQPGLFPPAF